MSAEATLYRIHCILQARTAPCHVQPSRAKTARDDADDDPSDRAHKRQAPPQELQEELAMLRRERDQLRQDKMELEQRNASLEATVTAIKTELETAPCMICLETLHDPVSLLCGHNYCSVCVDGYIQDKRQPHPDFGLLPINCPECRVDFQHEAVRPNLVLGRIANRFVEATDGQEHTEHAEDGVYTGSMFRGRREGRGVLVGKDGSRYEGEFKNGKQHGQGEMTYADGGKYVGQWKRGKREGRGFYTWKDGSTYDGEWKNDTRHGRGVSKKVRVYEYEGQFADGMKNGQGVAKYASGDQYAGQWKEDKKEGRGVYTWKNGSTYDGEWKNGMRHGVGIHKFVCGDIYDGEWKKGKRHGQGTRTYSSGKKHEGQWRNNKILPRVGDRVYFKNVDVKSGEFYFDITIPYILWGTVLRVIEDGEEPELAVKLDDMDTHLVRSYKSFVYNPNAVDPGPPEPGPTDLRDWDRVMIVGTDEELVNGMTGYVNNFDPEYGNWKIELDKKSIQNMVLQDNELCEYFEDIRLHANRLRRVAPSTDRDGPGFAPGDRVQVAKESFSNIRVHAPDLLRGTVLDIDLEDDPIFVFIKFDDDDQAMWIEENKLTRAHANDPRPPMRGPRDIEKDDRVIVVFTGNENLDGTHGFVKEFDKVHGICSIAEVDHDPDDELKRYHVDRVRRVITMHVNALHYH